MTGMDETSAGPGAVRLVHDDDRDRYVALDGETVVGVLYYGDDTPGPPERPAVRDLRSTVVAPDRGGRGVGSALVRFALEDIRARDLSVRPTCWFVRGWIERHPEFAPLLGRPDTSEEDEKP